MQQIATSLSVEPKKNWFTWRFRLLTFLTLAVIGNSVLIGIVIQRAKKDRRDIQKKLNEIKERGTYSGTHWKSNIDPTLVDLPANTELSRESLEAIIQKECRTALDINPNEWKPAKQTFKVPKQTATFSLDDMIAPSREEIEKYKAETPMLRSMPYPYFRALSIPWDPENSQDTDIYYSNSLLSRKFGLDFPCAFFPYLSDFHPRHFTLFCGSTDEPRLHTIDFDEVNAAPIDALPFFLTCYYRGWTDHIHGWTAESCYPHSIVDVFHRELASDRETKYSLTANRDVFSHRWRGFEFQLSLSSEIEAFEIELQETNGLSHFVVYKKELGNRPGWDISALDSMQMQCFYLNLSQELNRPWTTSFGNANSAKLKSASVSVKGKQKATFTINGIRVVDPDRKTMMDQMAIMTQYNILPAVATSHGGYTGWAQMKFRGMSDYPMTIFNQTSVRRPLGSTPGTPAYISDQLFKFGTIFLNHIESPVLRRSDNYAHVNELPDGTRYYETTRSFLVTTNQKVVTASSNPELTENAGAHILRFLGNSNEFGQVDCLYTHNNIFSVSLTDAQQSNNEYVHMRDLKTFNPGTMAVWDMLANSKYNLDGIRKSHQRIWCCPVGVLNRYALGLRNLKAGKVERKGNEIHITPLKDRVTGTMFPDMTHLSQDLHGQTFYVLDSETAAVYCGAQPLTSLQRNPPDFTGRPSVTVVDCTTPTKVFDEVDLFEQNGRVISKNASVFFQQKQVYHGKFALEIQSNGQPNGLITWMPIAVNSHETDFFRFAYKKTNAKSTFVIGWSDDNGNMFQATDGSLDQNQGWSISAHADSEWHEVILPFAEKVAGNGKRAIPRGNLKSVYIGIQNAAKGDSIYVDCIEFLAARGVRAQSGKGLVVGGRLTPPKDVKTITLKDETGRMRHATTMRGGWYFFQDVPKGSLIEITINEGGVTFYPIRGRVIDVCKNDAEYHLVATDPRSNSIPRVAFRRKATEAHFMKFNPSQPDIENGTNGLYANHSNLQYGGPFGSEMEFFMEDQANNFGHFDRDRRFDNPDGAFRVHLFGDCLLENVQSNRNHHLNLYLESFLRRDTGLNIEVVASATPNASPSSNVPSFEKYGVHFKPDVVMHMIMPWSLIQMEPTLQQMRWGWVKNHSPYTMFDFNESGRLVRYLPDPDYPAHSVKPDPGWLVNGFSMDHSYYAMAPQPDLTKRSFQLLKAVLAEHYLGAVSKHGGTMYVITGHQFWHFPEYSQRSNFASLSRERWLGCLKNECLEIGVPVIDISGLLAKEKYAEGWWVWRNDGHHTPSGNYHVARAIADSLLLDPEFQEKLRAHRARQDGRKTGARGRKAS